jgi:excisionase family DNA binding protein
MQLTVEEVAQRLNVHPETVRRYLREGHLKGVRRGGLRIGPAKWWVEEEEVERFKREHPTWGDE